VAGALSLTWAQTLANGRATAGDNPQISNGDATEYVGASATASLTAGADAAGFTGTVSVSRVGGGQSGYAITDGGTPVAALTADTGGAILGSAADLDLTATTDMALESMAGDITHKVTAGQQHRFEVDGNPLLSLTAAAVTYHQPLTSSGTTATLATSAGTWMTGTVGLATVVGNLSVGPSKAVLFPGLTETAALTAGVDAAGFTGMVSVSRVGDGGSGYAITDAGSPVVAMAWDGSDGIIQAATGSLHLGGDAGTQLSLSTGLVTVTGDVNIADGYLELGDISATPGTPTDAGRLYVEDGSLKYIGGSGTITPIAPA
jgi:hypothetical protein